VHGEVVPTGQPRGLRHGRGVQLDVGGGDRVGAELAGLPVVSGDRDPGRPGFHDERQQLTGLGVRCHHYLEVVRAGDADLAAGQLPPVAGPAGERAQLARRAAESLEEGHPYGVAGVGHQSRHVCRLLLRVAQCVDHRGGPVAGHQVVADARVGETDLLGDQHRGAPVGRVLTHGSGEPHSVQVAPDPLQVGR
jgi:hypothetical protein